MLRLLSDEGFHGDVVSGVRLRYPEVDLVRSQDIGLLGQKDPEVLAWAAAQDRILLTNDRRTMIAFAHNRVAQGLAMPGVFVLRPGTSIADAIEAVAMVALASDPADWANEVHWLPL